MSIVLIGNLYLVIPEKVLSSKMSEEETYTTPTSSIRKSNPTIESDHEMNGPLGIYLDTKANLFFDLLRIQQWFSRMVILILLIGITCHGNNFHQD